MTLSEMVQVICLYNGNVCGPKLKLTPWEKKALAHLRSTMAVCLLQHRPVTIPEQRKINKARKAAGEPPVDFNR